MMRTKRGDWEVLRVVITSYPAEGKWYAVEDGDGSPKCVASTPWSAMHLLIDELREADKG